MLLAEARQESNRDSVAGTGTLLTSQGLRGEMLEEFEKLNAAYAKLIEENVIFAEVEGKLVGSVGAAIKPITIITGRGQMDAQNSRNQGLTIITVFVWILEALPR